MYGTEFLRSNFFTRDFNSAEISLAKHFGRNSKYLPSTRTETFQGSYAGDEVYSYEKDGNGNITKVSVSNGDRNYVINSKYTCK